MTGRLLLAAASIAAAPTTVSEFVVPGGPAPRVAATWPVQGAEISAGVLVLKIAFDRAMDGAAWSYGRAEGGLFPQCLEKPRLLADRRTFVLLCKVAAHQAYAVQINAPRDFAAVDGRPAAPTLLRFTTGDSDTFYMHDALAQAGLTDADEPIAAGADSGAGVSRSATPP